MRVEFNELVSAADRVVLVKGGDYREVTVDDHEVVHKFGLPMICVTLGRYQIFVPCEVLVDYEDFHATVTIYDSNGRILDREAKFSFWTLKPLDPSCLVR